MRHRMLIGTGVLVIGLTAAWAFAQNSVPNDGLSIRKATDAYVQAFNKGDLSGIMAIWADDADYIDESGKVIKGRQDLSAMYKKSLQENKGLKVKIKTMAPRFFRDEVATQDGTALLTHTNGETEVSPFTAVWVRKEGRWLLAQLRELPVQVEGGPDESNARVKELEWLVGEWTHEDKDKKTTLAGRWMKGHKFLALDYSVHAQGDEILALTQIIGWGPLSQSVHSWVFDSHGGFGEGSWSRRGQTWTVAVAGVTSDGRHGTGTNSWTHVDDNTFMFQSRDRDIDGQPLPDVKITYTRVKR